MRDVIDVSRETDIERLRQVAQLLLAENDRLHRRLQALVAQLGQATGREAERLQLELALLREQLQQRNQTLFGTSSEKKHAKDRSEPSPSEPHKPQTGHGPTEQPALPVEEAVFELDEADCACPKCGGVLSPMVGQFEESEVVDVVERSFRVVREKRQKYVCACGECVETALGTAKPVAGGRYSLGFAATVAGDKFEDHVPLARQVRQMKRQGLEVSSQTLWDQTLGLSRHLEPSYRAVRDFVLEHGVVGMDETSWPLLAKGQTKKWWAWSLSCPEAVYYEIAPTRGAAEIEGLLDDYQGVVMCDGYASYPAFAKGRDGPGKLRLANCWSHARRKFVQAQQSDPVAEEMVDLIGRLYAIEKDAGGDPDLLAELRRLKSAPLIDEIQAWLLSQRALPQSSLGKAITYTSKLWPGLTVFLGDPRVPLDNNATERSIRGLALGRKNHYGSKSHRGTEVAALFYTLIESAKRVGASARDYLEEAARRAIVSPGTVTLPRDLA
jgi:transposase